MPVNYRALVQGHEKPKKLSAIVESQLSSSSKGREVHSLVSNTPEEMAQQLAQQVQAQQEQSEQLRAQAQSIDLIKQMLQQVLDQGSKKKFKHASPTSQRKDKGQESSNSNSFIHLHSSHEQEE